MTGSRALCLTSAHAHWPPGWCDLGDDAPDTIYVTGRSEVLRQASVAVVGTRRASPRGLAVARRLARDLVARGWLVVSGLAMGIDAAAHAGALDAGGISVGVMATAPQRTYPTRHRRLRRQLEERGCCVTETPPAGGPGGRWLFPRRNRLIAALAAGVIVVEAPEKSGALVTARLASELGRQVWAVPGPVDHEGSRGCHRLLREGAALCETAADIDGLLAPPGGTEPETVPRPLPGTAAAWILDRLDLDGVALSELRARWPGTDAMWNEGLLALELAELIRRLPGGRLAPRIWLA